MPVFQLTDDLFFPPPELADEDGLLAVGGDLSEDRLLLAYSKGIFPWYSENYPILWWSPDPRLVLIPEELKVARSLRQIIRRGDYTITFDAAFERVIGHCANVPRKENAGTWITEEMRLAYCQLHERGIAHSVESWVDGELSGGLYGVALGGVFFGESMFTLRKNASKAAFVTLVRLLRQMNFQLIDCQITTRHLISLGAREIPRSEFRRILRTALRIDTPRGSWNSISVARPERANPRF